MGNRKRNQKMGNGPIDARPVTFGPRHHFFGYYGICPWSGDGRFMLALEVGFIDHVPDGTEPADIGLVDLQNKCSFRKIASTRAWNWQQGCMLQWMPPEHGRRIIFNDLREKKFVSVILDIESGEERVLATPIYAVHPSGTRAVSIDFSRLESARPGYGYRGVSYEGSRMLPDDDGIYAINLTSGERTLMFSFADLCKYSRLPLMDEGFHWADHLTFNPDGSRFAFFHRFQLKDGRFYERLFTAASDGSDLFLLLDTGMASHFTWRNNKQVFAWGRVPNVVSGLSRRRNILRFISPVYRALGLRKFTKGFFRERLLGDGFLLLTDRTNSFERVGTGILTNGHPSFLPGGKILITDTYADANHFRDLLLYAMEGNARHLLGRFRALPDRQHSNDVEWDSSALRADLHPRLNRTGTEVCFDSVHEGSRQVYVADIAEPCRMIEKSTSA